MVEFVAVVAADAVAVAVVAVVGVQGDERRCSAMPLLLRS